MRRGLVYVIGVYQVLTGFLLAGVAMVLLFFTGFYYMFADWVIEGGMLDHIWHGVGRAWLGFLALGLLHMIAGTGLMFMQNWGRYLALLVCAYSLMSRLPTLTSIPASPTIFVIDAVSIFYLAMPATRRIFRATDPVLRAA